jgi:ATP synthase protein I
MISASDNGSRPEAGPVSETGTNPEVSPTPEMASSREEAFSPNTNSAPDKPPAYTQFRLLATASSIGFAVVIAIFLGLGLGLLLDRYLGTKPWFTIGGLLLGVAAGFRNLWVMAERIDKSQKK